MQSPPLVSIICLCYNHATYVIEALDSVIAQSYKNIQLIVVDDCSTDGSAKVIENWVINHPEVLFIKKAENCGNNKSFNGAFAYVKGDFFIDLAADDVLNTNAVEMQVNAFLQNTDVAMVFGNAELVDENGKHIGYHFAVDAHKRVLNSLLRDVNYIKILEGGNIICSVSAMIKTDVFKKLGGYDNSLAYEDLDLWIRLSREHIIFFEDFIFVKKRVLSSSQSSFFGKRDMYARRINYSTYKILQKAFMLNCSAKEHRALLHRVHFEIVHNFRLKNYCLMVRYFVLKLKIHLQIFRLMFFYR